MTETEKENKAGRVSRKASQAYTSALYNGLLRLDLLEGTHCVGFADDIAILEKAVNEELLRVVNMAISRI